jgi:hypothetical protein
VLVNLATIWFVVVMMLVQGLHDNANKATVIIRKRLETRFNPCF